MARIFDMENMSAVVDIDIDALFTLGDTHETRPEERACFDGNKSQLTMSELILHEKTSLFASQDSWGTTMSIIRPPSASMVPGDREDRFLFSHYVSQVSMLMIPIEDGENPWKSTYPSLALQERSSCSTRSLYNAILAQSAFHLASVKGAERGACDNARAVRHYGTALRELRNSLATPTEEYSSVLAALMTVIFVETVSQGQYRAWRHHFRGAMGFVSQYLSQKPWSLSRDAWNITQSFVLDMVLAYTAVHPSTTTDHISKLSGILGNVTREPRFGFTIGGNARLINTIYRILLLEEQFSAARYLQHGQLANEDLHTQAEEIVQELRISLEDDVDLYIKHQEIGSLKTLPRARLLVKLHLQLFNKGVLIYLLRMVLRHPPAAVADYVGEVLTDAIVFLDMNGGEPSIWPVFVAAVEAYTPESQALADHFFDESKTRGTGTREEMRSVIRQVWADRERLSAERQCSVGGIAIDWREVTKKMDVDILLL
ncbi:fungal-specific transcription factor domain-containing protein [Exophiala viscosa]|uniref:Fungal-specific transcription factor domain-containing protein n=1 Tax=Exophiala viscosa TaxID=2486360 RepID=A0AAN6IAI5_9EURO|nr:fungal-specific transcription factor domain-containing protein [Exophiala viscosa]